MAETSTFLAFSHCFYLSSAIIVESIRLPETRQNNIKGIVTSIQTVHGEIYDCTDLHKQLSLSHPALRTHEVKLRPDHKVLAKAGLSFFDGYNNNDHFQFNLTNIWKFGKGCPEGTVPIRREVNNSSVHLPPSLREKAFHGIDFAGIVSRPNFKTFYVAGAEINLQHPRLPGDEYSSASVYIESLGSDLNQIVAGWTVNPMLYKGDYRTRFFTFWRGSSGSGCYNLQCPGFIHTSKSIPLDTVFDRTSVSEGTQMEIRTFVFREAEHGWWLVLGNALYGLGELVGYWPSSLFTSMRDSANSVRFGGEVLTAADKVSSPPMGSGVFIYGQYDRTCHMRRVLVANENRKVVDGDDSIFVSVNSRCYYARTVPGQTPERGYVFYFGGAGGKTDMCLG